MRIRPALATLVALSTIACADSPTEPSAPDFATAEKAAPSMQGAQRVAVCHYDSDEDRFFLIRVSSRGGAVEAHLRHGDGRPGDPVPGQPGSTFDESCAVVATSGVAFARAWVDLSGEGYQPDLDALIAEVVDGNGDGVLNAGDRVRTSRYPTTADPTGPADLGDFTVTEFEIDGIDRADPTVVAVTSGIHEFRFVDNPGFSEFYSEASSDPTASASILSDLTDDFGAEDRVFIDPGSPSAPTQFVIDERVSPVDDTFLEVEISLPTGS